MNDQERLIELATNAWYGYIDEPNREYSRKRISMLQRAGITLTPPPAPERTYRITERQWRQICRALSSARTNIHPRMDSDDAANIHDTWLLVAGMSPEEE